MMPVMAARLLDAIELSASAARVFAEKCVAGIEANEVRCAELVENSLAMVTALAPVIGYDAAAEIAKEAYTSGKTVREVCLARAVLPEERLTQLLDPWGMTELSATV
jgi:fumarate hydratase class II